MLSDDQKNIIDQITSKKENFRILGRAGTGKTHTLQHLIPALRRNGEWVACVTPTGAAAVRVENTDLKVWAKTYHSYLGFRNPAEIMDDEGNPMEKMEYRQGVKWQFGRNTLKNKRVIEEVNNLTTLIIEECSMLDEYMFQCMDKAFQIMREDDRPFGGVRIVLVGDFKQLRPVIGNFMFNCDLYNDMDFKPMKLEKIVRTDQPEYLQFQQDISCPGGRGFYGLPFVESRWIGDETLGTHAYEYTHLYDTNKKALAWNDEAIAKLFPDAHFREFDLWDPSKERGDPRVIQLCEGMRVMITANAPMLVCVNGDIGTIVRFETVERSDKTEAETPIIKLKRNGQEVAVPWKSLPIYEDGKKTQKCDHYLPCRPAYASTVHKFQGITTDGIVIHNYHGTHGKMFVAATRCANGDSLFFHKKDMQEDPRTIFDDSIPSIDF